MSDRIALSGGTIYTPYEAIDNGVVVCDGDRIEGVYEKGEAGQDPCLRRIDLSDMIVCPGLIDLHLHGALGMDFLDALDADLDDILAFHIAQGITGMVPTLMTAPIKMMEGAAQRIAAWLRDRGNEGTILGIHLEGPFINKRQSGVLPKDSILAPDRAVLNSLIKASQDTIKILTLAPELDGAEGLIPFAKGRGIVVSAGHSEAAYEETEKAIKLGVGHACHFFNALRAFHHRMPGIIGAVLVSQDITAELILDGIHTHPVAAKILFRMLGPDRMILVTDCSPLLGAGDGTYIRAEQAGRQVWVKDEDEGKDNKGPEKRTCSRGEIRDTDGRLAGSSLTLPKAIRHCLDYGICGLPEAITMATANPARLLRLDNERGELRPGYRADITVMDRGFRPTLVMIGGKIMFMDKGMEKTG